MPFYKGDPVTVAWAASEPHGGKGIVWDVVGGPGDFLYQVLMDGRDGEGNRTMLTAREAELSLGAPPPALQVGDPVTYRGRAGVVTDESNGVVVIVLERDPVEDEWGGVSEPIVHMLPTWQIHAYNR